MYTRCSTWRPWSRAEIASAVPHELNYPENPIEVAEWEDRGGYHLICIAEDRSGTFGETGWQSVLSIDVYKYENGTLVKTSSFSDSVIEMEDVEYLNRSLLIKDADNDGYAEAYAFYRKSEGDFGAMVMYIWNDNVVSRVQGPQPTYDRGVDEWEFVDSTYKNFTRDKLSFIEGHWKKYYMARSRQFNHNCDCY